MILAAISSRRTDNTAAAFDLGMLIIQLDRYRGALQNHLEQVYGNGRTRAELLVLAALLVGQGGASSLADAAFSSDPGSDGERAYAAPDKRGNRAFFPPPALGIAMRSQRTRKLERAGAAPILASALGEKGSRR